MSAKKVTTAMTFVYVCELNATLSGGFARPVERMDADGRSAEPDSRRLPDYWRWLLYALDRIANR